MENAIKIKAGWIVFATGILLIFFPIVGSRMVDDLRLDPWYWMRFEFSRESETTVDLKNSVGPDASIRLSFSKGNSGAFYDVEMYSGTNRVGKIGGDERTYVGFRNVDADEGMELLFSTGSIYGSGDSVWKYSRGSWVKMPQTPEARRAIMLATALFYGPGIILLGIILCLVGLPLVASRPGKKKKEPER